MQDDSNTTLQPVPMTLLRAFIDPKPIADSIANARWYARPSEHGYVECLDPTRHGRITGQICEYFSQQQLLDAFSKTLNQTLATFAGNIVRCNSDQASSLLWQAFDQSKIAAALAVNIGPQTIKIACVQHQQAEVDIQTGEAVLMSFAEGLSFNLLGSFKSLCLIEGYYFKNAA